MTLIGRKRTQCVIGVLFLVLVSTAPTIVDGLNGGTPQLRTFNGWKVFEVITEGDNPSNVWPLPGVLDGTGAYLGNENELRIQVNHELATSATISEVALHVPSLKTAISNMIRHNSLRGQEFVIGSRRGYSRYTLDAGLTWKTDRGNFRRFCSAQSYTPRKRGFVDQLYITGEETGRNPQGRLVVLHSLTRDMYILSGVTGGNGKGNPGFPFDSFENAAWIDTKENRHIALVLSADSGSETLMLYVGERGKGVNGQSSNDVLARNGLAYGSWFFLKGSYPNLNQSSSGSFGTGKDGALSSDKMEDVDTSPSFPTRVVLGDQNTGVFVLDFALNFSANELNVDQSTFSIKKIANHIPSNNLNGADNADWTALTTLKGRSYPQGIIFMNEDTATGEIWTMTPDGGNKVRIGDSKTGGESTGILDVSELLDYAPGSIVLSNNFGSPEADDRNLPSAMQILINPEATEVDPQPVAAPPEPRPIPAPIVAPTRRPTSKPVPRPTRRPTPNPVPSPTRLPTVKPVPLPTRRPTPAPVPAPTRRPTTKPGPSPTANPVPDPVSVPRASPTASPVNPPPSQRRTSSPAASTTSVQEPSDPGPIDSTTLQPVSQDVAIETQGDFPPQTNVPDSTGEVNPTIEGDFSAHLATLAIAAIIIFAVVSMLSLLVVTIQRKRAIAARKRYGDLSFDTKTEDSYTHQGDSFKHQGDSFTHQGDSYTHQGDSVEVEIYLNESHA